MLTAWGLIPKCTWACSLSGWRSTLFRAHASFVIDTFPNGFSYHMKINVPLRRCRLQEADLWPPVGQSWIWHMACHGPCKSPQFGFLNLHSNLASKGLPFESRFELHTQSILPQSIPTQSIPPHSTTHCLGKTSQVQNTTIATCAKSLYEFKAMPATSRWGRG